MKTEHSQRFWTAQTLCATEGQLNTVSPMLIMLSMRGHRCGVQRVTDVTGVTAVVAAAVLRNRAQVTLGMPVDSVPRDAVTTRSPPARSGHAACGVRPKRGRQGAGTRDHGPDTGLALFRDDDETNRPRSPGRWTGRLPGCRLVGTDVERDHPSPETPGPQNVRELSQRVGGSDRGRHGPRLVPGSMPIGGDRRVRGRPARQRRGCRRVSRAPGTFASSADWMVGVCWWCRRAPAGPVAPG